ncbi:pilus assembly protein TadG-related protein [Streptomyces sp. NPDC002644]
MVADDGQTMPLYIWLTGILLFAALAFFAFAQAASTRNTAQTAADAAALAAASEARDQIVEQLSLAIEEGEEWRDWLTDPSVSAPMGGAAQRLASANGASIVAGPQLTMAGGYPGFRVQVQQNSSVGDTVIPGTEGMHAKAAAVAVLQPRCEFAGETEPEEPAELECDGEIVNIDPENFEPDDLPDASVLFSVNLAE